MSSPKGKWTEHQVTIMQHLRFCNFFIKKKYFTARKLHNINQILEGFLYFNIEEFLVEKKNENVYYSTYLPFLNIWIWSTQSCDRILESFVECVGRVVTTFGPYPLQK